MLHKRLQTNSRLSPVNAGGWVRLLAALLFACYVNYIPVHLATASHGDPHPDSAEGHHHDAGGAHHHHPEEEGSHPGTDHALSFLAPAKTPVPNEYTFAFPAAIGSMIVFESQRQFSTPPFERSRPPGEFWPDPRRPRAPPAN